MNNIYDWPLWKWAIVVNIAAAFGIALGLESAITALSPRFSVPIVVFTAAFINLMLLVIPPRVRAARTAGAVHTNPWAELHKVVLERPLVFAIVILQLIGTSRSLTAAVIFIQTSHSSYVRSLSNATIVVPRMRAMSVLMTAVTIVWVVSTVGLWRGRRWSWWLAVVLNGLAAGTTAMLRLLVRSEYLLDTVSALALVVLLLPTLKRQYLNLSRSPQKASQC